MPSIRLLLHFAIESLPPKEDKWFYRFRTTSRPRFDFGQLYIRVGRGEGTYKYLHRTKRNDLACQHFGRWKWRKEMKFQLIIALAIASGSFSPLGGNKFFDPQRTGYR